MSKIEPSADIWNSSPYRKVIYTGKNGYDHDHERMKRLGVVVGQEFWIEERDVGNSSTSFRIKDVATRTVMPEWHNSVIFRDPPAPLYTLSNADIDEFLVEHGISVDLVDKRERDLFQLMFAKLAEKNDMVLVTLFSHTEKKVDGAKQ